MRNRNTELHTKYLVHFTLCCVCVHVSLFLDMCGLGAMLKQFQNSGLWVHEPIRQRQRQRREILSRGIKPHIAFIAHIYTYRQKRLLFTEEDLFYSSTSHVFQLLCGSIFSFYAVSCIQTAATAAYLSFVTK